MENDEITAEMSVDTLLKILKVQAIAVGAHEAAIKSLRSDLNELKAAVEGLPAAIQRSIRDRASEN